MRGSGRIFRKQPNIIVNNNISMAPRVLFPGILPEHIWRHINCAPLDPFHKHTQYPLWRKQHNLSSHPKHNPDT